MMWLIGNRQARVGSRQYAVGKKAKAKLPTANCQLPTAFTLIELLISVAILSIGLVGVIGAFISSLNALQRTENRLSVLEVLEAKIWEIEDKARKEGGIETGELGGDNWALEATAVEPEEDLDLSEDLNKVDLRVWTTKDSHNEQTTLITLMRNITDEE